MPELPEVQTTVNGLNQTVKGKSIVDVSTSYNSAYHAGKDNVKDPKFFKLFRNTVRGKKILGAERRAKNILINLSEGYTIIVHMKMTGNLLYGDYALSTKSETLNSKQIQNSKNQTSKHIHLVFELDNGKQLALSDLRKFAKVTVVKTSELDKCLHLENLGPEPLEDSFKYENFRQQILKRPKGKVKQVLLDQTLIAGIGNIYSDEILWRASVHPVSAVGKIPEKELKEMFKAMKGVLQKGIELGGDSMSDYRNIHGEKGEFQEHHKAYRRTGEPCTKRGCSDTITRAMVATRSAHFCPAHQKLYS